LNAERVKSAASVRAADFRPPDRGCSCRQAAADPRNDALRRKWSRRRTCSSPKDYFDPGERYIANSVQLFFKDASPTGRVSIDDPIGHHQRRAEGIQILLVRSEAALCGHIPAAGVDRLLEPTRDPKRLDSLPTRMFLNGFVTQSTLVAIRDGTC
jgi:2-methylcitrate dehydratase